MRKLWIGAGTLALACAASVAWMRNAPTAQAQVNVEGCSCTRPSVLASGAERLSVYHCVCPGMQCVITATAATASAPPNLQQSCTEVRR